MAKVPSINIPVTFTSAYEGPADSNFIPCPEVGGWTGKFVCPHIKISISKDNVEKRVKCLHAERTLESYKSHWMADHWRPQIGLPTLSQNNPDPEPRFRSQEDPDDQDLSEAYLIEDVDDPETHTEEFARFVIAEMKNQGAQSYPIVFRTPDLEEWVPHRIRTLKETRYTVIDLSLRER